jgi:hypothetical protein
MQARSATGIIAAEELKHFKLLINHICGNKDRHHPVSSSQANDTMTHLPRKRAKGDSQQLNERKYKEGMSYHHTNE